MITTGVLVYSSSLQTDSILEHARESPKRDAQAWQCSGPGTRLAAPSFGFVLADLWETATLFPYSACAALRWRSRLGGRPFRPLLGHTAS